MNVMQKSAWKNAPMLMLISLGLMILPVSNSIGQIPLYAAGLMWLIQLLRKQSSGNRTTWIMLGGWMILILISLTYAVHPELGIRKLSRFFIFPLTGAVAAACVAGDDLQRRVLCLCESLVFGVCILGLYDIFCFPYEVFKLGVKFEDVGDMTSPQFYLVGIMLWLGLVSMRREQVKRIWWVCLPFLMTGLLMHQKRGVWLATMVSVGIWTLWSRKWKTLLTMILIAGVALCFPFVRGRLGELMEVIQPTHGGRMVLWNEVAPRVFEEYPWGMGYNGSKYEDFRDILPAATHMEVGLRHLHNNFLQIRLELGWLGVLWWLLWMGLVFYKGFRQGPPELAVLRGAVVFAFLGLFLNGLVEYNFGDSEILKVYLVLLGLIDAFQPANCLSLTPRKTL
ncbi:O-antigen ligase family protein [Kiritimatiellaeota bacterium B1221]|nr:O-antigen ligase family protein [Kiritimatiellaeota bacterium B1221]